MIKINGREYKLTYIDTNVLSEFVNNTLNFSKNFSNKYFDGKHILVTSPFNIMELNETQKDFIEKAIEMYQFPLGILNGLEMICEYERNYLDIGHDIIIFVVYSLFQTTFRDLMKMINNDVVKKDWNNRKLRINEEIKEWEQKKLYKNEKWQKEYKTEIEKSMQEIVAHFPKPFQINSINSLKSLELVAYVKNMFINNKNESIKQNSIIDSYNVANLYYVDEYITERTVASWLNMAKDRFKEIKNKEIIKLSDFYDRNITK